MKVIFNNFWNLYNDACNINYFLYLFSKIHCTEVKETDVVAQADILCECIFDNFPSLVSTKEWKCSYLYSGESRLHNKKYYPDVSRYKIVLSYLPTVGNFVSHPHYLFYNFCNPKHYSPVLKVPDNFCCAVIANATASIRTQFLVELDKYACVTYGGSYKNNIGARIGGSYDSDTLLDFYRQYKFVIAMENSKAEYYITEKIVNAIKAGVIPVYWGTERVSEYINPKRYIMLNESNFRQTIDIMINMTDQDYLDMVSQPIYIKDGISETINNCQLVLKRQPHE